MPRPTTVAIREPAAARNMCNRTDEEDHQEDHKEDLGDARGSCGDPTEAKDRGDDREKEENDGQSKHVCLRSGGR